MQKLLLFTLSALVVGGLAAGEESQNPFLRRHHHEEAAAPQPVPVADESLDAAEPQPAAVQAPPPPAAVQSKPQAKATATAKVGDASRLPTVSTVLGGATETLESITSQVDQLAAHVHEVQKEDQKVLASKKADFESRLQSQEDRSRQVNSTNGQIASEITGLKARNSATRKRAAALQEGNKLMRTELRDIKAKLNTAVQFIVTSLGATDDHHAKELTVLTQASIAPKPTKAKVVPQPAPKEDDSHDDDDDDDSSDDDDDKAPSFLETNVRTIHPATDAESQSLMGTLSKGLKVLAEQEKQGEKQLETVFHKEFQAGKQKRAQLLQHQKKLNGTRTSLKGLSGKLEKAEKHLDNTRDHLKQRLHSVGTYLQHLSHLILAPPKESEGLIAQMPKAVPMN